MLSESRVTRVEKWNGSQHCQEGSVQDADTILADIVEENVDHGGMQESGIADEVFQIWKGSSCRSSVESIFHTLTGKNFEEYLELCEAKILED